MLTDRLIALLRQQFPRAEIADDAPDLQVGSFPEWDSLAHFNFLLSVEEHFEVRFSLEEMAELKSLAAIARALTAQGIAP